jgi:hypothetical protein
MADHGPDIRADTRWLSYEEAGHVLGIDPDSVARRARRLKWPRLPGNDGKARVAVPADVLPASGPDAAPDQGADGATDKVPDNPGDRGGHVRPDESRTIKALEGEASALREALARERERADRAETAAAVVPDLRERAARAEGESAALREQITVERTAVREQVTAERQRAEASARDLEAARAELADWTAGGPVARAWRAFLNRRGRS